MKNENTDEVEGMVHQLYEQEKVIPSRCIDFIMRKRPDLSRMEAEIFLLDNYKDYLVQLNVMLNNLMDKTLVLNRLSTTMDGRKKISIFNELTTTQDDYLILKDAFLSTVEKDFK